MNHWLMKTEPDVFGIDDFLIRPNRTEGWNGVRNFEARNLMRDRMKVGDLVIIYHSNAKPSGAAGVARVASTAYPDPDQFDQKSEYYDPKSTRENPRWMQVDVEFVAKFPQLVSLDEIRAEPRFDELAMLRRNRLSVTPLTAAEFRVFEELGNRPG
ncbi:MAG: EVE domain-containing protein [Gammaproteobacteria bacterium]